MHVVHEARGHAEDKDLELKFLGGCKEQNSLKKSLPFKLIVADKKANSEDLQFADLIAQPIAYQWFVQTNGTMYSKSSKGNSTRTPRGKLTGMNSICTQ